LVVRGVWGAQAAGSSPAAQTKVKKMGKVEKKRKKLQERIEFLQDELKLSLTKKDSSTAEIDVASHRRKIQDLQKQLKEL
jgi:hypothetical protein